MKPKKKSPIKAKPLRSPGQSLDEQLQNLDFKVDELIALCDALKA